MRFKNASYLCTPLKAQRSLIDWEWIIRKERENLFSFFFQKILASLKISVTFAAANPEVGDRNKKTKVLRHIELTAVPMQIGTQIKRVRESVEM